MAPTRRRTPPIFFRNEIRFDIPGEGPHRIRPLSPLPELIARTEVDGYTQPGARANGVVNDASTADVLIELDGSLLPAGNTSIGLHLGGGGAHVVRGLALINFSTGVRIGPASVSSRVIGNFIGTTTEGLPGLGNDTGIDVLGASARIGGPDPDERNVISGNNIEGLFVRSSLSTIDGNLIGLAPDGQTCLGNFVGVAADASILNLGSTSVRSVIACSQSHGIVMSLDERTESIDIVNNQIGYPPSERPGFGNGGDGIAILVNSAIDAAGRELVRVGGDDVDAENIIAGNGGSGVSITSGTPRIRIDRNQIFDNQNLGIDRGRDGVTFVDPIDVNFPILETVAESNEEGLLNVEGVMPPPLPTNEAVELTFYANTGCDGSGHGEGQLPLDTAIAELDAVGQFAVAGVPNASGLPDARFLTATARHEVSTSEFSACILLPGLPLEAPIFKDGFESAKSRRISGTP